jgi:hypothetical protein
MRNRGDMTHVGNLWSLKDGLGKLQKLREGKNVVE